MNLPTERITELQKLADQQPLIQQISEAPLKEQADRIQGTARMMLGIEFQRDITELEEPAKSELLFSMTALRDKVIEARAQSLIWPS